MHKAGENSEYFRKLKEEWSEEFEGEDQHDPKTPYFRAKAGPIVGAPKTARLFEFVIPTVPLHTLDKATISEYRLRLEAGERPTALAISVLDVTDMRGWEPGSAEEDMHWCLAHYLLDGHHKTVAASQTGLPLRILSFTSVKHSMAAPEIIELCLQHDASEVGARDPSTE